MTWICQAATRATREAAFSDHSDPLAKGRPIRVPELGRAARSWCAPSLAAKRTAAALGLDPVVAPALADCDYGRWRGLRLADVMEREPEAVAAWLQRPELAPHGGESLLDVLQRVAAWMDAQGGESGHGVVVTAAPVIRAAILHALGAPAASFWRIDIAPSSLTDLRCHAGRWTLRAAGLRA